MSLPTLGWLCNALQTRPPQADLSLSFGPISIDTRTIQPGNAFWALKSGRDGHDFVAEAFAKGAKVAVVDAAWAATVAATPCRERLITVTDTHSALSQAARQWRQTFRFPVLGITGTNGKTSTKDLLLRILSVKFRAAGTRGNLNNEIGVPLSVLAVPDDCDLAIIELGASHEGEIAALCQIAAPTHGLVTSIGRAHLEGFGSPEGVFRAKKELFDFIAADGTGFVPTDDLLCIQASVSLKQRIGYSFDPIPAIWTGEFHIGESLTFDGFGRAGFLFEGEQISLAVPGKPAALTALSALTVAQYFEITPAESRDVIAHWEGVHGRTEIVRIGGILLMDDSYNANPTSMRAALQTLSLLGGKRRVAILGDMNELGAYAEAEHRDLGQDLKSFDVNLMLCLGRYAAQTAAGATEAGVNSLAFEKYEDLENSLREQIREGDVVLVKGSRSMKLERAVQHLREMFS